MLDLIDGKVLLGIREMGCRVTGVKIAGNRFRFYLKDLLHVIDGFKKKVVGFRITHLPYVLAQKGCFLPGETNGVFHFSSHSKEGCQLLMKKDGTGNITAGPSGNELLPGTVKGKGFYNRVIASKVNVPVVGEEEIHARSQSLVGFIVIGGQMKIGELFPLFSPHPNTLVVCIIYFDYLVPISMVSKMDSLDNAPYLISQNSR